MLNLTWKKQTNVNKLGPLSRVFLVEKTLLSPLKSVKNSKTYFIRVTLKETGTELGKEGKASSWIGRVSTSLPNIHISYVQAPFWGEKGLAYHYSVTAFEKRFRKILFRFQYSICMHKIVTSTRAKDF